MKENLLKVKWREFQINTNIFPASLTARKCAPVPNTIQGHLVHASSAPCLPSLELQKVRR